MEHQTNIVGGPKASAAGPGPDIMAADTLEGNDVYNAAGEELGSILVSPPVVSHPAPRLARLGGAPFSEESRHGKIQPQCDGEACR